MAYDNLSDYLAELQDDGDLVRIAVEVDPVLEAVHVVERVCQRDGGGPAVFFENIKGHSIPMVANLLGSERRLCRALQADSFDQVAERVAGLIKPDLPDGWLNTLKLVPRFAQLATLPPKTVNAGICQQVVKLGRDVNLGELPIPQCWPNDPGPTITRGQVLTRHSETGVRDISLTPLHVDGQDTLCVHWSRRDEGWRRFVQYQREQRQMPVAVVLGGDPVLDYTAAAPLPPNTDAFLFAGFLRGKGVELVKCRSNDLAVPTNAEIIIEGFIDTDAPLVPADSIAAATGYYRVGQEVPRMQVTAVTHRANPMFPILVRGRPPMEDYWLNQASMRIFRPLVRLYVPEVVDYHMPRAGVFRHILFVSIRKEYAQQARKVMNALWSLGPLTVAKLIVVVDGDVDVRDEEQVWFHVGANVHPGRDTVFCEGPGDMDDHAAPIQGMGHKLGLDATRKLPEEGHSRPWPDALTMTPEIKERVSRRWADYGLD